MQTRMQLIHFSNRTPALTRAILMSVPILTGTFQTMPRLCHHVTRELVATWGDVHVADSPISTPVSARGGQPSRQLLSSSSAHTRSHRWHEPVRCSGSPRAYCCRRSCLPPQTGRKGYHSTPAGQRSTQGQHVNIRHHAQKTAGGRKMHWRRHCSNRAIDFCTTLGRECRRAVCREICQCFTGRAPRRVVVTTPTIVLPGSWSGYVTLRSLHGAGRDGCE